MNLQRSDRTVLPVLPLRDVVVYPHMVIPLFVGREKSIRCLEVAMEQDKKILLNPALNPVVSRVLLYRNLAISLSILIS